MSFLIHPTVIGGVHSPSLAVFAWIYLVPLLIALRGKPFSKKFLYAFLSSVIGHYGLLFWLATAMQSFGGLNWIQAVGVLTALVLVLSAVTALFIAGAHHLETKTRLPIFLTLPLLMTLRDFSLHFVPFGGYPWGIAPYSQGNWLFLFQWVDWTGVFGLSVLIYGINGLMTAAAVDWNQTKNRRNLGLKLGTVAALFLASFIGSRVSLNSFETSKINKGSLNLALIQPNIQQDAKWDPNKARSIIQELKNKTLLAKADGAQLVLWPETSFPYGFAESSLNELRLFEPNPVNVPVFFGAFIQSGGKQNRKQYNVVLHADETGKFVGDYRKIHLVPFGEYLPLAEHLKFMEGLTQGIGHFAAGTDYNLFSVNGIQIGSLICIEDVFPRYAKEFSKRGADLLVNYTNDAWYGDSSAQYQHVVYSQFRALENRKPLVRVTNTGISAVIDARGVVLETLPPFRPGYLLRNLNIETSPASNP